jgi:hypothetical protein
MGLTTAGAVFDRVNSVVAAAGFTLSKDQFSFELQPSTQIDAVFRVEMSFNDQEGNLGSTAAELQTVDIWIARAVKRDARGAYRQLIADLDIVEGLLADDYAAFDYNVEKTGSEIRPPEAEASYVVARLSATVDFDRAI